MSDALQVRSCEAADIVLLNRIGSPLVRANGRLASTRTEIIEALFIFTRPHSESAELLARGRDTFREAAVSALDGIQPAKAEILVGQIGHSLLEHLNGTASALRRILKS